MSVMDKWEYKIFKMQFKTLKSHENYEPELNRLGEEGWELVSTTGTTIKGALIVIREIYCIFKRKKK